MTVITHDSPGFINSKTETLSFFEGKKFYRQTDFYKWQRKKHQVLVDASNNPEGGKWTFDSENRKKYPKGKVPPAVNFPKANKYHKEAVSYVRKYFGDNYGSLSEQVRYPCTFSETETFFQEFLDQRFHGFGPYQDAILPGQPFMHHSLLSPMMNSGLLTPSQALNQTLAYAKAHQVPLSSLEGFVRQILGWREFIRGVYEASGNWQRTRNFWGFTRKIPESFWTATTGLSPVDQSIESLLQNRIQPPHRTPDDIGKHHAVVRI